MTAKYTEQIKFTFIIYMSIIFPTNIINLNTKTYLPLKLFQKVILARQMHNFIRLIIKNGKSNVGQKKKKRKLL